MPTFTPDLGTIIEQGGAWTIVINRNQNLLGKVMYVLSRDCDDDGMAYEFNLVGNALLVDCDVDYRRGPMAAGTG